MFPITFQLLFGTTDLQLVNTSNQETNLSLSFDDKSHPFGNWHVENWSILKIIQAKNSSSWTFETEDDFSNTTDYVTQFVASPNANTFK